MLITLGLSPIKIEEVNQHNIDEAIRFALKAQEQKNHDFIWQLANHSYNSEKELISANEVVNLFEKIEPTNPHFKDAQFQLANILMSQEPSDDEEENIARREQALLHAFQSGEQNQSLVDQIFHKLCGYENLTPVVLNVKGDFETLIKIAEQTRNLINQNKELQAKLAGIGLSMETPKAANTSKEQTSFHKKEKEKEKEKESTNSNSQQQISVRNTLWSKDKTSTEKIKKGTKTHRRFKST